MNDGSGARYSGRCRRLGLCTVRLQEASPAGTEDRPLGGAQDWAAIGAKLGPALVTAYLKNQGCGDVTTTNPAPEQTPNDAVPHSTGAPRA